MTPSKSLGMHRLPSALSMFKGLLHLPEEIQKELDWLAAELGDARDWDVLSGSTLPMVAKDPSRAPQVEGVQQAATDRAQQHHIATSAASTPPLHPSHAQHDALGASWAGVRTRKQWRQWATSWCSQSKSLPEKF